MAPSDQSNPRKRTRMSSLERRANDGLWTPGMGLLPVVTSSTPQTSSTHSSPFAAPSPYRYDSLFISPLGVEITLNDTGKSSSYQPIRLRSRALPSELDTSSLSSANESPSSSSSSETRQVANREQNAESLSATRPRPSATVANAQPRAQAVVAEDDSPFWSTAGGIFHPDAQNPMPVSSSDAQALEQLPDSVASQSLAAGISALVFESAAATAEPTIARTRAPQALASQRSAALASVLSPFPLPSTQSPLPQSSPAAPSTVIETLASTATASSLVLTTTLVSASSPSSSSSSTSSSTSASGVPSAASSTSFFSTLGSSPLNITITVLVCVGILALIVAILFFFIRRCTLRRKRRRLGDILASEYGSPAPGGGGGMSEWATPGPNWTEKFYGEQVGGRMVVGGGGSGGAGAAGVGAGNRFGMMNEMDEAYLPQGRGDGDGGYGVARSMSQQRRTSEWANYRTQEEFGGRGEWDERDGGMRLEDQTHVLGYDHYSTPAPLPPAAIRHELSEQPPLPSTTTNLTAIPVRPSHLLATNYTSYCSDSTYPVDEAGDVEAEKMELSQTMQDLNLGRRDSTSSPPAQTSWRDSLDWVMGSAADLIGSKLLARGGSADTLVASPPDKLANDRFTQRPPSIRIPRASDPRLVPDQFTPLSPSYGNRFLNPPSRQRTLAVPPSSALSRQSSLASLTSSANFATTKQAGTFAQSARSRLFDAALAKNAQEEDEMEVLGDIAGAMMSRQTTNVTLASEYPPEIPYPQFDQDPFHDSRRFVDSPDEMSGSSPSNASTSSSFTDRPSPLSFAHLRSPSQAQAMNHSTSLSSLGSKASFDAFGRESLTPREYQRRQSMSRQRTMSRKSKSQGVKAPRMKEEYSVSSISTINDFEIDFRQGQYLSKYGRSIEEQNEKAREMLGERRRRSQEFEESLV